MSIITKIKTGFLKRKFKHRSARNAQIKKADEFQSVLLVLEKENEPLFKEAGFIFRNAELNALFLRDKKEDGSGTFCHSIHASDFNLTGLLKNDKLQKLFYTKFDLVVDLSRDSELLNYFINGIESGLVIGRMGSANEPLHDLLLEPGANEGEFLVTIQKQLNLLTHG